MLNKKHAKSYKNMISNFSNSVEKLDQEFVWEEVIHDSEEPKTKKIQSPGK